MDAETAALLQYAAAIAHSKGATIRVGERGLIITKRPKSELIPFRDVSAIALQRATERVAPPL